MMSMVLNSEPILSQRVYSIHSSVNQVDLLGGRDVDKKIMTQWVKE